MHSSIDSHESRVPLIASSGETVCNDDILTDDKSAAIRLSVAKKGTNVAIIHILYLTLTYGSYHLVVRSCRPSLANVDSVELLPDRLYNIVTHSESAVYWYFVFSLLHCTLVASVWSCSRFDGTAWQRTAFVLATLYLYKTIGACLTSIPRSSTRKSPYWTVIDVDIIFVNHLAIASYSRPQLRRRQQYSAQAIVTRFAHHSSLCLTLLASFFAFKARLVYSAELAVTYFIASRIWAVYHTACLSPTVGWQTSFWWSNLARYLNTTASSGNYKPRQMETV